MKEQEEAKRFTDSPKGAKEQMMSSPTIKTSPKSHLLQQVISFLNSNLSNTYSIFQVFYISKQNISP